MPYRSIAALAAVGVADTAYLTAVKLLHLQPACPLTGGCADVLTSEYATLFGVLPLSVVGLAAYAGMGALALAGARQEAAAAAAGGSGGAAEAEQDASPLRTAVLAGGLAMASTSSVLLYILLTRFAGDLCPWCLGSAAVSFGIAALAASGLRRRELEEAAGPGVGVVAATLLFMATALGAVDGSAFAAGGYDLDYAVPAVTTASPPRAVALAQVRCRPGCVGWGGRHSHGLLALLRQRRAAVPATPRRAACLHSRPLHARPAAPARRRRPHVRRVLVQPLLRPEADVWGGSHGGLPICGVLPRGHAQGQCGGCQPKAQLAPPPAPAAGRRAATAPALHRLALGPTSPPTPVPHPPARQDTKLAEACQQAPGGLTGFPTWVMPDGQQLVGEQTFEELEAALDAALAAPAAAAAS